MYEKSFGMGHDWLDYKCQDFVAKEEMLFPQVCAVVTFVPIEPTYTIQIQESSAIRLNSFQEVTRISSPVLNR